jgi:hypothetical protein
MRMGLAFWENGYTTLPFFNLAPTFGRVKTSILHGAWRFQIFPNFWLKLDYTKTFTLTVGIFV